jgi:UDP-N-acetylmuramyl pentapeptide phosphotransferase/UDP-N-acetylglucosamine-1-phosphate transferase
VALTAVAIASGPDTSVGRLLGDAALVALAANLGNLLDRGPGRAIKVGLASFLVLALATTGAVVLTGAAVVVGAAAALLVDDLHERLMLGDTGANVLGAVVGLGVVLACSPGTRLVVLVVLVALNLASEVVSFSRVIDAVPPLRALDRAGRLHR